MKVYTEKTRIKSYHVDKHGKLSTIQVFNFLQEAAFSHSVIDKFGQPDLAELGLIWMLSRMKVVFVEDVSLGDEIEINSWVRSIKGALSERDFELKSKGKVIAQATSLWACLSIDPVKPTSISEEIRNRMVVHKRDEVGFQTSKISPIVDTTSSYSYTIMPSDIDMVNHTNNVVYIRMVLDLINSNKGLKQVEINYLLQSFEGDALLINSQMDNNSTQIHEIINEKKNVVCRLKTEWE